MQIQIQERSTERIFPQIQIHIQIQIQIQIQIIILIQFTNTNTNANTNTRGSGDHGDHRGYSFLQRGTIECRASEHPCVVNGIHVAAVSFLDNIFFLTATMRTMMTILLTTMMTMRTMEAIMTKMADDGNDQTNVRSFFLSISSQTIASSSKCSQ